MKRAYVLIREQPNYRRDAFAAGLSNCGYSVQFNHPVISRIAPDDVLLTWNRYGVADVFAREFEKRGAKVLVAENPYMTDVAGEQWFALARDHHNGFGRWRAAPGKAAAYDIEPAPWRQRGSHVLVLAQRGIGEDHIASPPAWEQRAVEQLKRVTKRPVVVRAHPGKVTTAAQQQPALFEQLRDCWAVYTWASAAAVKCILNGVPAFYDARTCAWRAGGRGDIQALENPFVGDRSRMLADLFGQQFTIREISTGSAVDELLAL